MENHLLLYKKKKMDPIVHRVTGSYLGFERKNIEKKGRKEDTVAENDGIHLLTATSTPELTCSSREEKRRLLTDNRRRMMVRSDRQWTMQLPSPSSNPVQRAFLSSGKKGMKKCKEEGGKKYGKSLGFLESWSREESMCLVFPLFPLPSSQ